MRTLFSQHLAQGEWNVTYAMMISKTGDQWESSDRSVAKVIMTVRHIVKATMIKKSVNLGITVKSEANKRSVLIIN